MAARREPVTNRMLAMILSLHRPSRLFSPFLLVLCCTGTACGQDTRNGRLERGDRTLDNGEYYDEYTLDVEAGQWVELDMTTEDFDPYLVLVAPSGENEQNDDFEGSRSRSYLRHLAEESGTWRVLATSYAGGETGRYRLRMEVEGGGGRTVAASNDEESGVRFERGELRNGDETLTSGEYRDEYTFQGRSGESVVIELRSGDFDPYLILKMPNGEQLDNDDHEGDLTRSLISTTLPEDGTYRVLVTTYEPGETGDYDLSIRGGSGEGGAGRFAAARGRRQERGDLASGDETLRSGEFYDTYTFEGVPGQRVTIDLRADDFDPYLILQPPRGDQVDNDDFEGNVHHSQIALDLSEAGTYRVLVTSYRPGERGAYNLAMDFSGATLAEDHPGHDDPGQDIVHLADTRDASRLTLNQTLTGALDRGDQLLSSGEFVDVHTFDGEAGEPVRIELTSTALDPYLMVTTPSGEQIDNDDAESGSRDARIEMVMPETGRYQVRATSYSAGETGAYRLRISQLDAMRPDPPATTRIVGLFVGLSDYGGRTSNLDYTAADAGRVRDALVRGTGMRPNDAIVLTDREATVARFRQAIADLSRRADERTMFVLFFSGHGDQVPRGGVQDADPDGKDETIELFDGAIRDDELARMLDGLRAGRQLIVLDACFSGGFSKDLITRPGRMGLFSSEEDIVSAVATKFEAGGYLSYFFADGLAQRQADEDRNGAVTALELSTYLHERYRGDVRDSGTEVIRARETRLGHQQLVVDRGSVGPFDTLFLVSR
ncbi:MAG TPA: pre-peptidase C-terminal domain-containing protein [Rubricoccaceae bacterium]|nr:pre-peptidase C-terminal domain-containing protein [Rubricoccaceae bacterium]